MTAMEIYMVINFATIIIYLFTLGYFAVVNPEFLREVADGCHNNKMEGENIFSDFYNAILLDVVADSFEATYNFSIKIRKVLRNILNK